MKNRYVNFVIQSGLYNLYIKFCKYSYYFEYKNNRESALDDIPINILPYADFFYYVKKYPRLIAICEKLRVSHKMKVRRVRSRVCKMLYNPDGSLKDCLFLTLTFTDSVLSSTSQQSRRAYTRRYLKSQHDEYLANIDFGAKQGREHYHSVIGTDFIDPLAWSYGTCHLEKIRSHPEKIAYYINKLTYHSVKDTTGFLIYSR